MKSWSSEHLAGAAAAQLLGGGRSGGPERAVIDSRQAGPQALFVGLPGSRTDGGRFASQALAAGAWGVLVAPEHAQAALAGGYPGAVLSADDPLRSLQRLATAW